MMSMHNSTHSSQMNTVGPAISLRTSCWLLPQKEQYRVFLASPSALAIVVLHSDRATRYDSGGKSTVQRRYMTLTNRSAARIARARRRPAREARLSPGERYPH